MAGPDPFAPPAFAARGLFYLPTSIVVPAVFSVYSGIAPTGTPLAYASNAVQTVVVLDSGSTVSIAAINGFPTIYPYTLLLEWGTSNQEVVTVTSRPTGNGPYTFTGVLRGQDGTTAITHASGSQVNHGVSARDFYANPPTFNVLAYGADPNGILDSTVAFQSAYSACVSAGSGIMTIPDGTFKITAPVGGDVGSAIVYVQGSGRGGTIISYWGIGDCLRIYSSSYTTPNTGGGGISGLTVDGTNAIGIANGLHMGDIFQYRVDITIRNFTIPGSVGFWFDNQYHWTEQLQGSIFASNCASNVVFDNAPGGATATATGSFERMDLIIGVNQGNPSFDGVVFRNGAFLVNGNLRYRGNFGGAGSSLTSAALRLTGSTPAGYTSGTTFSVISNSFIDIGVECASAAFNPQTIVFGVGSNSMGGNLGVLNFGAAGTFTASNNAGNISMNGVVSGDSSLSSALVFNTNLALTGGINYGNYAAAQTLTNGSTIALNGSYATVTSAAAVTGILMPAQFAGSNFDGQYVIVTNTGAFSITFAAAASSLVADGVSDIIAAGTARAFAYNYNVNRWYHLI